MRDTIGQTLFAMLHRKESLDSLVYSQFYSLIKTLFNTAKTYVFSNKSLENLALNPKYIKSLQQKSGSASFSKAVCEFAYLYGKMRARANLIDSQQKLYRIQKEHQISLSIIEEIQKLQQQQDLYNNSINNISTPLLYYTVLTQELLSFLYAQINKHCFLFKYTLAQTARSYSLPKTLVIVVALQALQFCYSSNLLQQELLLYKNRQKQACRQTIAVKEGLRMQETIERCGLGQFLPKFNQVTVRLAPLHRDNILVENLLMHKEYRRQQQAVKDLCDVYVRFYQAEAQYSQYNIRHSLRLLEKQLEYLYALNLEQFDSDIQKAMLKINRGHLELTLEAIQCNGKVEYCYQGIKEMFIVNRVPNQPYFVTRNKMQFKRVKNLLTFLFLQDKEEQLGQGNKLY